MILSGLVFNWIKSANSLAGQFEKAMETGDEEEDRSESVNKESSSENNNSKFVPKEALDGTKGAEGSPAQA